MTTNKIPVYPLTIWSIGVYVFALFFYGNLFDLITPKVFGVFRDVSSLNLAVVASWKFCLVLAFVPIAVYITNELGSIQSMKRKLLVITTVVLCMIVMLVLKQRIIVSDLAKIPSEVKKDVNDLRYVYPVEHLNYEGYILMGLIGGCIISYLFFSERRSLFFRRVQN